MNTTAIAFLLLGLSACAGETSGTPLTQAATEAPDAGQDAAAFNSCDSCFVYSGACLQLTCPADCVDVSRYMAPGKSCTVESLPVPEADGVGWKVCWKVCCE